MTDAEMIEILRGRIEQLMETQELLVEQRNVAWERVTYSFNAWKTTEANLKTAEEIGRAFEEDAGQLRAKLAKAVEALREVEESSATYQERAKARAVLEELG
jgi:hypothetical protein